MPLRIHHPTACRIGVWTSRADCRHPGESLGPPSNGAGPAEARNPGVGGDYHWQPGFLSGAAWRSALGQLSRHSAGIGSAHSVLATATVVAGSSAGPAPQPVTHKRRQPDARRAPYQHRSPDQLATTLVHRMDDLIGGNGAHLRVADPQPPGSGRRSCGHGFSSHSRGICASIAQHRASQPAISWPLTQPRHVLRQCADATSVITKSGRAALLRVPIAAPGRTRLARQHPCEPDCH